MKAAYCEIKRGRNCVTVNYYSKEGYGLELGCRKLERERREAYAAKRRRLNRIRENIGAGVGMLGFLLLLCAGGTEEISTIIMTGAAGLVLMVLGGWLGDRFDCYRLLAPRVRRPRRRRRGAGHGTGAARVPGGHLYGQHRMRHRQRRGVQVGACVLHEASRDCQRHRGHDGRPGRLLSAARTVGIDAAVQHERPRICRLRRLRPRLPGDFAGHEEDDSVILRARSAQSVS